MNQLERIYRIHDILSKARYPIPISRFIDELECTRNTITRDFCYMRDFLHAPIEYVKEANGHRYSPNQPVFELPGFWLNASELYALLVCEQLLEDIQPGLMTRRLAPFKQRIRQLLQQSGSNDDRIENKLHIQQIYSRVVEDRVFMRVADATFNNCQLVFDYHARGHDDQSTRRVSPQRLVHYRHCWYLLAWCHQAEDLRLFALDRISNLQPQTEAAHQLSTTQLDAFAGNSFGIFYGTATHTAHLRFNAKGARWAADEIWHNHQKSWWEGGHYHLEFPYANATELVMEILRHGPEVEVIGPPELRAQVVASVQQMARNYCTNDQ